MMNNNQNNPNIFPGGNPFNPNGNGNGNNLQNYFNANQPNRQNLNSRSMMPMMNNNMLNNNMSNNMNYNKAMNNQKLNKINAELENQIRAHLKCYIRLSEIHNPKMCKYCKRICCQKCIDKWLRTHSFCGICKHEISSQDMVDLQFLDGVPQYFLNLADNHPNNNNISKNNMNQLQNYNNNNRSNNLNNNNNINIGESEENRDMCQLHKSKIEYYCVQCNKYFCSNCLVFFGEEVKKHSGHLIIQLSKMNESGIKEALIEYKKLSDTQNDLDDLIGKCNFKLRENLIKITQIENFMKLIKNSYVDKIDETSKELNTILSNLKTQKESVENSITSIPNGFKNIINSNDYMQSSIVSAELKKINKIDNTLEDNIKEKLKINPTLFAESYETDYIDFKLPFEGQYKEGAEILNYKTNMIRGFPSVLILKYLQKKVIISFSIEMNYALNATDVPKFYNYITIKNQKYGLEFINLSNQIIPQNYSQQEQRNRTRKRNQINSNEIDAEQFIHLAGEEKKIRMKVYATKVYFK